MGHEIMGEVVEVGRDNKALKVGDRIVVPFTIICGECDQCRRGNFSVCERSNRNKAMADKVFGHTTAGLFGYTHLTGGYAGRPGRVSARALRRHDAHQGARQPDRRAGPVPGRHLPDRLAGGGAVRHPARPTRWRSGAAGPVGQMAIRSAVLLGAKQVIAIDNVPERLAMARGRRRR